MADELVTRWRANALYNKAWRKLPNNPQWLKLLFQDHPDLLDLLVNCVVGRSGWDVLVDRIKEYMRQETLEMAQTEVATGSLTVAKIQDTLEN